jgi:hypothetical protein
MDVMAEAKRHLQAWRDRGETNTLVEMPSRFWNGQPFVDRLPVVGYVRRGCGAPLVPDSSWAEVREGQEIFTVRVK